MGSTKDVGSMGQWRLSKVWWKPKDLQDLIEASAEYAYYKIGSGVSYSCCIILSDSLLFK